MRAAATGLDGSSSRDRDEKSAAVLACFDGDLAGDAAGQPAGEREPETGAPGTVAGETADAGLEDRVPLVGRNAGPVILDEVDDPRRVAFNPDPHTTSAVPAGVLHHRLKDAFGQIGVQTQAECLDRPSVPQLEVS